MRNATIATAANRYFSVFLEQGRVRGNTCKSSRQSLGIQVKLAVADPPHIGHVLKARYGGEID